MSQPTPNWEEQQEALLKANRDIKEVSRTHVLGETTTKVDDYRVDPRHCRGGDDEFYSKANNLKMLPRGLAFIFYLGHLLTIVCGLPKFGDESNKPACVVNTDDYEEVKIVFLEKANGECFHLGGATTPSGVKLWIFGSKNVHFTARVGHELEDISKLKEERYEQARKSAELFIELGKDYKLDDLHAYLSKTGNTIVAETTFDNNQHLVKYSKNDILGFAITNYRDFQEGYTAEEPEEGIKIMQSFGLTTVPYDVIYTDKISNPEFEAQQEVQMEKIFNKTNSEGMVKYVVHRRPDGKLVTTMVTKCKAWKYVYERACREKTMSRASLKVFHDRFSNFHLKDKLGKEVHDTTVEEMLHMYAYCHSTWDHNDWSSIRSSWCTVWERFQKTTPEERSKYMEALEKWDLDRQKPIVDTQIRFQAVGIPGCSKTTLLKALMQLINGSMEGYLDQDMISGQKGKAARYHNDARKMAANTKLIATAFGKSHHDEGTRKGIMASVPQTALTVWVEFYHPGGVDELIKLCLKRITNRGPNHQTLCPSESCNVEEILNKVFSKITYPSETEEKELLGDSNTVRIDVTQSKEEQVNYMFTQLCKVKLIDSIPSKEKILDAIDTVYKQELELGKTEKPASKSEKQPEVQFWSLEVTEEKTQDLIQGQMVEMSSERLKWIHNQKHHITLLHKKQGNCKEDSYTKNQLVVFRVSEICWDDDIVALKVELPEDIPCQNKHPHITLMRKDKTVKPYHSNNMFESDHQSKKLDFELYGVIRANYY